MGAGDDFGERFDAVLEGIAESAALTERFLDTELYRVQLAALWASAVSRPASFGLAPDELEGFYDFLNERTRDVLGDEEPVLATFRHLLTPAGEQALIRARAPAHLRDFLLHFAGLMVDPDGLGRRVAAARDGE